MHLGWNKYPVTKNGNKLEIEGSRIHHSTSLYWLNKSLRKPCENLHQTSKDYKSTKKIAPTVICNQPVEVDLES